MGSMLCRDHKCSSGIRHFQKTVNSSKMNPALEDLQLHRGILRGLVYANFYNWYFRRHFPMCFVSWWAYLASVECTETQNRTDSTHKGAWCVSLNKFILIIFVRNSVT